MTKIWLEAFWKPAPDSAEGDNVAPADADEIAHPVDGRLWPLVVPCVMLALCTLVIGFAGGGLMSFTLRAAEQLLHPDIYVSAVLGGEGGTP